MKMVLLLNQPILFNPFVTRAPDYRSTQYQTQADAVVLNGDDKVSNVFYILQ